MLSNVTKTSRIKEFRLSWSAYFEYKPDLVLRNVPRKAGVYCVFFLYKGHLTPLFVGRTMANDLQTALISHFNDTHHSVLLKRRLDLGNVFFKFGLFDGEPLDLVDISWHLRKFYRPLIHDPIDGHSGRYERILLNTENWKTPSEVSAG